MCKALVYHYCWVACLCDLRHPKMRFFFGKDSVMNEHKTN